MKKLADFRGGRGEFATAKGWPVLSNGEFV